MEVDVQVQVQPGTVLIIGGGGFIGSAIARQLAAHSTQGTRLLIPTRRREALRHLWLLPACDVVQADVHNDADLNALVARADAVINLVGILHGDKPAAGQPRSYGSRFDRAHRLLPQRIVAACLRHRVRRLVHMSALGADPQGPSMYQRSKGDGEALVMQAHGPELAVTALRPSVVFGEGDSFLSMFKTLLALFPVMPLAGAKTRFAPIWVQDVAQAFVQALQRVPTFGQTYDLVGPETFTLAELVNLVGVWSGHPRLVVGLPDPLARVQAAMMQLLPGEPLMTADNLDSMRVDNISPNPAAVMTMVRELGVDPTPLSRLGPRLCGPR